MYHMISNNKYPRTLYFSECAKYNKHNSKYTNPNNFVGSDLVVTIKMDGSNVKLNHEFVAARNGLFADHKSFDMLKQLHSQLKYSIPEEYDIFGEWLYAKHSIQYDELTSYLQIFSIYNRDTKTFLSWDEVISICDILKLETVPIVLVFKPKDTNIITEKVNNIMKQVITEVHEGIVVRKIDSFFIDDFSKSVFKCVRPNHVQTDVHWSSQQLTRNKLK